MPNEAHNSDIENKILQLIDDVKRERKPRKSRSSKIDPVISDGLTVAAFEAARHLDGNFNGQSLFARYGSIAIGIATFLAPFLIFKWVDPKQHSLYWDRFGIISTLSLLFITFGIDSIKAFVQEFSDSPEEDSISTGKTATGLFVVCCVVCYFALGNLGQIHMAELANPNNYPLIENLHFWHVGYVFSISILFIAMDFCVAHAARGQRASFAASSSMTHSTMPMIFGNLLILIWFYLGYYSEDPEANHQMTQFVTGALTFQMITSNILFILINENVVFRICRRLSYSTVAP